jgi:HEAT repeat protein
MPARRPARSIAELIRELGADDFSVRQQAQAALIAEGASALPALRQAAKGSDLEVARRARACIPVIETNVQIATLIAGLRAPNPQTRMDAGRELKALEGRAVRAVPALLVACDDEDPRVREQAVETLSAMGPGAKVAIPKLMEMLQDQTQPTGLRWWAEIALGGIGRRTEKTIPLLRRMLDAKEADLRNGAAHALGDLGPRSARAIPRLIELLKDPDLNVQISAASALGEIGREPSTVVPALTEFVKRHRRRGPSDGRASCALVSLAAFGPAAKASLPVVLAVVADDKEHFTVRVRAIALLGKMGPGVKQAVATLQRLATDPDGDVVLKDAAVDALTTPPDP